MPAPDDFDLGPRTLGTAPSSGSGPPLLPIAIIGALVVAAIVGGGWWLSRKPPQPAPAKVVNATDAPITPPADPSVTLPSLDDMDPFMRKVLGSLSAGPELARWLATESLIRQLAAAIDVASQGKSPAHDFKVVAPTSGFLMSGRGNRRTIDPSGYRRYNGLVTTVTSIDASALARAYRTIQPRLNEAYQKRGHRDGDVDRALNDALRILIATPILRDPTRLVEGVGARWAFADPKIEALAPSQKQLLRMGADNVDKMLVWLRALQSQL